MEIWPWQKSQFSKKRRYSGYKFIQTNFSRKIELFWMLISISETETVTWATSWGSRKLTS